MNQDGFRIPTLAKRTSLEIRRTAVSPPPPDSWTGENTTPIGGKFNLIDRSGTTVAQRVQASEDLLNRYLDDQACEVDPTALSSAQGLVRKNTTTSTAAAPAVVEIVEATQVIPTSSPPSPRPSLAPRFAAYKGEFAGFSDEESASAYRAEDANDKNNAQASGSAQLDAQPLEDEPLVSGNLREFSAENEALQKKKRPQYSQEDKISMFQQATTTFKMHSYVGNWWQAQLKSDPDLKAEHDSFGKDTKRKRNLREKKIQERLDHLEEEYMEEEIEEGGQELQGVYLPFSRIWQEEGKDEEALVAAREYVKTVVEMHKQGEKGPKKQPWCKSNSFTKRVEYLYVKAHVVQRWLDRVRHIKTRSSNTEHTCALAMQPPKSPPPRRASTAAAKIAAAKAAKAAAAVAPTKAAAAKAKAGVRGSPRNQAASSFATLKDTKALHVKMKTTMASATDIMAEVLTNDEWKDIRHLTKSTELARAAVEEWRAKRGFWRQWTVSREIDKLQVDLTDQDLATELKLAPQLVSLLDGLENEVADLVNHQRIAANGAKRNRQS